MPSTITTWWAPSTGDEGTEIHGTACAEIVYDIAPDADFYLATANTEVEFANAVDWLIAQGVDVITHSAGWYNAGPGNGTGFIDEKVDESRTAGILWVAAAGNSATTHWMGSWTDTNANDRQEFAPTDETNSIWANTGDSIVVQLSWDDPWGSSSNDYELLLYDPEMTLVASSTNEQNGDDDPTEALSYTAASSGYHHIVIQLSSADGTAEFRLFTFHQHLQYQVAQSSMVSPADSPSAMTVGAAAWYDPNVIEYFSSQGPTTDGRIKPDLVAPDRVSTVTYGSSAFPGTSASAPNAAGAAVLVKERYPFYSPAQIQSYLERNAVDLGESGKDNIFGSGRLTLPGIGTTLSVDTVVGSTHFRGEVAEFSLRTSFMGNPVAATTINAILYNPDGVPQSLTFVTQSGATGLYKAEVTIPTDAPIGQYTLTAQATYTTESVSSRGTSLNGFLLSETLTGWDAWLLDTHDGVATIQTDIGAIRTDVTTMNASVTGINSKVATIQTNIGTIKTDVSSINASIAGIDGSIVTIQTDVGTIKTDVTAINASISGIDGSIVTIQTDVGTIKTDVTAINAFVSGINGSIVTIQTDVGTIKTDVTAINASVSSINGNIANVQADIGILEGKLISIEGNITTIATNVGNIRATISEWIGETISFTSTKGTTSNVLVLTTSDRLEQIDILDNRLTIIISGAAGTRGMGNVLIPNTILTEIGSNMDKIAVTLDGNEIPFSYKEYSDISMASFSYTHSTHTVEVWLTGLTREEKDSGLFGGCACNSTDESVPARELVIGWGILGLCWGGGYYMVRRQRK